jgi:hypothetical protein
MEVLASDLIWDEPDFLAGMGNKTTSFVLLAGSMWAFQ